MKSDNPTMSAPAEVLYVYCCTWSCTELFPSPCARQERRSSAGLVSLLGAERVELHSLWFLSEGSYGEVVDARKSQHCCENCCGLTISARS